MKRLILLAAFLAYASIAHAQQSITPLRVQSSSGGTITVPSFTWMVEPSLGIYRAAAGVIGISGGVRIQGNATLYSGSGAPSDANGANGDFYFRSGDGTIYRKSGGTWSLFSGGGGGSVTSVNVTLPSSMFAMSGGPVLTSGVIAGTFQNVSAKLFWAGPVSGSATTPAYRQAVLSDLGQSGATSGQIPKWDGTNWAVADDAGAASGAPTSAQYVTLVSDATLLNERVFTAGAGIAATDGGAGSTITIAADGPNITALNASNLASGTVAAARMPALTGDVTTSAGAVATTIANDAVTYAKMQNVSAASKLLGRGDSGSGDAQEITIGTGLAMAGTTISATGGGGSGAADETHTLSSSASADFTTCVSSSINEHKFVLTGVLPATDGANLLMLVSTDGGSTWLAGTTYLYGLTYIGSNGSSSIAENSGGTTSYFIAGGIENTTSTSTDSGEVKLFNLGSSSRRKTVTNGMHYQATDGNYYFKSGGGALLTTSAINAVQFKMSTGNIAEGTIACYRTPN